jgi:hypothetical protein
MLHQLQDGLFAETGVTYGETLEPVAASMESKRTSCDDHDFARHVRDV